jgi:hypothetical protein
VGIPGAISTNNSTKNCDTNEVYYCNNNITLIMTQIIIEYYITISIIIIMLMVMNVHPCTRCPHWSSTIIIIIKRKIR